MQSTPVASHGDRAGEVYFLSQVEDAGGGVMAFFTIEWTE